MPDELPSISEGAGRIWLAWKPVAGPILLGRPGLGGVTMGRGSRKHPVTAVNDRGDTLLAWSDGTGWQKGGAVEWQLFDSAGRPTGPVNRADGLPVWGLPAVVAEKDGNFVILFLSSTSHR
jgi:hypothetical protein